MPRIVVLDNQSEDGLNMMKEAGIEYEVRTGLKGEDLRQTLNEFDAAICRSGVKITPESLEGNTRLKAIARAGVGVDNIDLKAATRHGIIVMNTPGGNTNSTAEQTFALMLATADWRVWPEPRNAPLATPSTHKNSSEKAMILR